MPRLESSSKGAPTRRYETQDRSFMDMQDEINVPTPKVINTSNGTNKTQKFNVRTTEAIKTHENKLFDMDIRTWISSKLNGKRKSSSSENNENPEFTGVFTGEENFNNMSNILDELGQEGIETSSYKDELIRGVQETVSLGSSPESQPEISKAVRHKRNILDPISMMALNVKIAESVTPFSIPKADTPNCRTPKTDDDGSQSQQTG